MGYQSLETNVEVDQKTQYDMAAGLLQVATTVWDLRSYLSQCRAEDNYGQIHNVGKLVDRISVSYAMVKEHVGDLTIRCSRDNPNTTESGRIKTARTLTDRIKHLRTIWDDYQNGQIDGKMAVDRLERQIDPLLTNIGKAERRF